MGIDVVSETADDYVMALCPLHDNRNSPALSINTDTGKWVCFNPSCEERGRLPDLVRAVQGGSVMQAELFIAKNKRSGAQVTRHRAEKPAEFPGWSEHKLDLLHDNFLQSERAQRYMRGRGFDDDTLDYFNIGYSPARITDTGRYRPEMVTVPMHDHKGSPIGLIGRGISEKQFKNSRGLPKRYTAWNIHRARKSGGSLVVTEASFDGMRVHQAGYPNVVSLLGGSLTDFHVEQIDRYFNKVIIMTDFEQDEDMVRHDNCKKCGGECRGHRPGRDLGRKIASKFPHKKVMWATYDDSCVYPHGAKDVGDMTDNEIRQCLRNAISNVHYRNWGIEG